MSDLYGWEVPDVFSQQRESAARAMRANEIVMRAKLLTKLNPYMAQRPEALMALSMSDTDTFTLADQGAAMYGIQTADTIRQDLEGMDPTEARSVYYQLTPAQQKTLVQQGYEVPEHEEKNLLDTVLGVPGAVFSNVFQGAEKVGRFMQLDDVLNGMIWLSDRPAHLYRAVRTMDGEAQLAALAGAAIAVGAALFVPVTGGLSLAALGLASGATGLGSLATLSGLGLAAGAGAAAGSLAASATNPSDWANAFRQTYNGERTFEKGALREAERILGDSRLINAARDLADLLPEGFTLNQLATEAASTRGQGIELQNEAVSKFAARFADEASPEHAKIMAGMLQLMAYEPFQRAVNVLQNGKISVGRDFADALQLRHGSTLHKYVSGAIDAAAVLALDPTLMLGRGLTVARRVRYGVGVADAPAIRFAEIYRKRRAVQQYFDDAARAVRNVGHGRMDGYRAIRVANPELKELFPELLEYRDNLLAAGVANGGIASNADFTGKHIVDWITNNKEMATFLQGYGTIRGYGGLDYVLVAKSTPVRKIGLAIRGTAGAFTRGLTDRRGEEAIIQAIERAMETGGDVAANSELFRYFPESTHDDIRERLFDKHIGLIEDSLRATARRFDELDPAERARFADDAARGGSRSTGYTIDVDGREVDLTGIELFDNTVTATVDELDRIVTGGIPSDFVTDQRVTRALLRDRAYEGEDFAFGRMAGRALGGPDGIGRAADRVGRFFSKISTMAPSGAWLNFEGRDAPESIRAFMEMAALGRMPAWMREEWVNAMLLEQTSGLRVGMAQSFYENMLRLAGVHTTQDGLALIEDFTYRVRQSYAPGAFDLVEMANGRTVRRALLLDEMAGGVAVPDLSELKRIMRVGRFARMLGWVDLPVVEQFQARVWKPSVLLRFGFIPRASGEEMLAFFLRGGIGSIGQEFGARSLYRGKRAAQLELLMDGNAAKMIELPIADRRLLAEFGRMPAPVRPLMRMLSRMGYKHPSEGVLERFVDYYYNLLETGVGGQRGQKIEGFLSRMAGTDVKLSPTTSDLVSQAAARRTLSPAEINRLARTGVFDSVVFGNPHSWRRMVFGGVNDDLVEAADKFWNIYGTTISRAVGATSAGPVGYHASDTEFHEWRMEPDFFGRERPTRYIRLRGERTLISSDNDILFDDAFHADTVKYFDDELTEEAVVPFLAKVALPDVDIGELALLTAFWHSVPEGMARKLIATYLDRPTYSRLRGLADSWERADLADVNAVGRTIATLVNDADITPATVLRAWDEAEVTRADPADLRDFGRSLRFKPAPTQYEHFDYFVNNIIDRLDALSPETRSWVAAYIKASSPEDAVRLVFRDAADSPTLNAWRASTPATGSVDGLYFGEYGARRDRKVRTITRDSTTLDDAQLDAHRALYNTYDDAMQDARTAMRALYDDPHYSFRLQRTQGLLEAEDAPDQWALRTNRPSVQRAWVPPTNPMVTVTRGGTAEVVPLRDLTPDEFVGLVNDVDGQLAQAQRQVLLAWFDNTLSGRNVALADRNVADAISIALTRGAPGGDQRAKMIVNAYEKLVNIPDGPIKSLAVTGKGRPDMWIHEDYFPFHPELPSPTLDEAVEQMIDNYFQAARAVFTGRTSITFEPNVRRLEDGTLESAVFRMDRDGNLVPVPIGQRLTESDQILYDKFKNRIKFGDQRYFTNQVETGGNTVMHGLISPMIQDAADVRNGHVIFTRRSRLNSTTNQAITPETDDLVRVYNSTVSDVNRQGVIVPKWIDSQPFVVQREGVWDSFVRYGFDRVIGPSIDALARRPMAFHYFAQRYAQNKARIDWLIGSGLRSALDDITASLGSRATITVTNFDGTTSTILLSREETVENALQVADYARLAAFVELGGFQQALDWNANMALAWLRGHDEASMADMFARVETRIDDYIGRNRLTAEQGDRTRLAVQRLRERPHAELAHILPADMGNEDILAYVHATLTKERLLDRSPAEVREWINKWLPSSSGLHRLTETQIETLKTATVVRDRIAEQAAETAAQAAILDMLPYIDSHEMKTQFAEIGKGFLPFWYAEENFMKRWARTLIAAGPEVIQKAQLTYLGLRTAGFIREDNSGRDWFIWPGSGLLQDALSKLPFAPDLPVGSMFQSPTDGILPGFNARAGVPQFGPMVSMPVSVFANIFPELEPFELAVLGEIGATGGVMEQIIPRPIARTYNAFVKDDDTRLMSAWMSALAYLQATGQGIEADATPGERDEYLREVRNYARIVVIAQAIGGWFSPGPLSQITVSDEDDLIGLGVKDPSQVLNKLYVDLVQEHGIEEGTVLFQQLVPYATLEDMVDPLAFTVARAEGRSGAPMPANELTVQFYDDNREYLDQNPYATPWLLPVDEALKTKRSIYAYDQQTINGMRKRLTPEEFLNELKFKEGSTLYFAMREEYETELDKARQAKDGARIKQLNSWWALNSDIHLKTHPVFAEGLLGSAAKTRRRRVIDEMRRVVNDLAAPQSPVLPLMQQVMTDFDNYLAYKAELSLDQTTSGRLKLERWKNLYEEHMVAFSKRNPQIQSFWISVLRPEAELD